MRAIYENERKSDELDARMLAKLARADVSLLYPINHVSEQAQRDLSRIKLRDNLVRQRVDVISSVRFIFKSMGIAAAIAKHVVFCQSGPDITQGERAGNAERGRAIQGLKLADRGGRGAKKTASEI